MPRKNHGGTPPLDVDEREELESARETLSELAEGFEEALDPELTREELVAKVKELQELLPECDDDEEEDEE